MNHGMNHRIPGGEEGPQGSAAPTFLGKSHGLDKTALRSRTFKAANIGESPTSLGRAFQWLIVLSVNRFPLVSGRNLPRKNSRPSPLVFSL